MSAIITDIYVAKDYLDKGEVVGFPTETVYGLAGNIYNESAIQKIFSVKQRPSFNPLIIHIGNITELYKIASDIPDQAYELANIFWPGPLTLILKKHHSVPYSITAQKDTVAVRLPGHPLAQSLLSVLDYPLAAPSANPFGSISPTCAQHVSEYFHSQIPCILDGGVCEKGIESTIVGFNKNVPMIYRKGSISIEDIENVSGKLQQHLRNETSPDAPGMLSKHYSPSTPLYVTDNLEEFLNKHSHRKIALLSLHKKMLNDQCIFHQEILSEKADLKEAGKNLYAALHRLDKIQADLIVTEEFPDVGLGKTINDRLWRASKK